MILKWVPVFICRLLKVLISTLYPIFILWVWGQEVLVLIMISNNKLPNSSNIMQMHSNMHGSQITTSDVWHPPNGQWTKGRKAPWKERKTLDWYALKVSNKHLDALWSMKTWPNHSIIYNLACITHGNHLTILTKIKGSIASYKS